MQMRVSGSGSGSSAGAQAASSDGGDSEGATDQRFAGSSQVGQLSAGMGLWVPGAVLCGVASAQSNRGDRLSPWLVRSGLGLAIGAVVLLVLCGYVLGRSRRWIYLATLVGCVWALLLALYIAAMLSVPVTGPSDNDNAAGAGLAILAVPVLFVVATLVGMGAGAGLLVGHLSGARTRSRVV
jgi:hypothetical protein